MKIKITLACLFVVVGFPLMATLNQSNAAPFATVALAGHVYGGGAWCQCGCDKCICAPSEVRTECNGSASPQAQRPDASSSQSDSPAGKTPASDFDFGAGAMLIALALLIWMRLRL